MHLMISVYVRRRLILYDVPLSGRIASWGMLVYSYGRVDAAMLFRYQIPPDQKVLSVSVLVLSHENQQKLTLLTAPTNRFVLREIRAKYLPQQRHLTAGALLLSQSLWRLIISLSQHSGPPPRIENWFQPYLTS